MQTMRYATIAKRFEEALQAKTSWGRNEVLNLLKDVLLETADDEFQITTDVSNQPKPQSAKKVAYDTYVPF